NLPAIAAEPDEDAIEVDFGRDIRPILADRCFKCHGPDGNQRQAELRLDRRAGAVVEAESGEQAIVPGQPELSELLARITHDDDDLRMPPGSEGDRLTDHQIDLVRQWIEQGADYSSHWSFVPPERPATPQAGRSQWPLNAIDHFILAQLNQAGWQPSVEANRRTLIRRLSFDLLGLPPSIAQVEAFVADPRLAAYEHLVDRMLDSPHFGERMAQDWLDLSRYADTTGFAADTPRPMWLYRDWVIKALNDNMPFDQFTIEQLAGDMLPNATDSQKIATGFHRSSMQALGNNPPKEEFRVKGIIDRVNTTGRVWLGLTVSCAECHDHKFDPVKQKEYYQLFAFFNNVPHNGENFGVQGPRIKSRSPLADLRRQQIHDELALLRQDIPNSSAEDLATRQADWEREMATVLATPGKQHTALIAHWPLSGNLTDTVSGQDAAIQPGRSHWVEEEDAPAGKTLRLEGEQRLRTADSEQLRLQDGMTITAWIKTDATKADIVCKYDSERGQRAFVFGIGGEGEQNATPGNLYAWITATP
ncbi:MAG: DUF1549 domain-containing protein, partial [Planctomycetales bacterium]